MIAVGHQSVQFRGLVVVFDGSAMRFDDTLLLLIRWSKLTRHMT